MSQARVTDFFTQRKKILGEPAKTTRVKGHTGPGSVREEFVRVIDEAAGLGGESVRDEATRTPKRSSAKAEASLLPDGGHPAAKKGRQAGRVKKTPEKTAKRSVRKKLVLQVETPQDFHKVDVVSLKSQLHRIKQRVGDFAAPAASSSSCPSSSSSPCPTAASEPSTGLNHLTSITRVRELAARAKRREEQKGIGANHSEAPSPDSPEQPAYRRYHNLAQATPPGLSLPLHYRILAEMFRSMDTVVAMMYNRCETSTFSKIRQGVQDMMHRRFEETHLGQIQTVFPGAYSLRQEKNVPTFSSSVLRSSYQLTVEPLVTSTELNQARPVLSASRLLERRRVFYQNLVSMIKQHHKVFLASLVPPVSVPEDRLTRWHPRFNVDTVPEVQPSPLPPLPTTDSVTTAQEVLDRARSIITPKMEKALVSLADRSKSGGPRNPSEPVPAAQVPASLKGVSQSLLDRIRAKEAQKLQTALTRSPAQEERLLMMSRLGELARILRNVFVSEKKAALIMEVVCSRMVTSYRSALSTGEMEKHLCLLAEVAADWLTIHPIRKDVYLKLNKQVELSVVLDRLTQRLREEERV